MSSAQQLIDQARSVTPAGEDVLAAGVFAIRDDHIANAVGAIGGSAIADELIDNPLAEGAGAAAGIRAAREAHAAGEGVSLRMLVAVTDAHIRLFRLGATGETPGEELMCFNRSTCSVDVSKFGASEHIDLRDGDTEMNLTGGVGFLSAYKDGNKKVASELDS